MTTVDAVGVLEAIEPIDEIVEVTAVTAVTAVEVVSKRKSIGDDDESKIVWSNDELLAVETVLLTVGHQKAAKAIADATKPAGEASTAAFPALMDGSAAASDAPSVEGASEADGALEAALRTLGERAKGDEKLIKRVLDAMLAGWLRHADATALKAWAPLSLHSFSAFQIRAMASEQATSSRKKRQKSIGSVVAFLENPETEVVRTAEVVTALGLHPRPKGQAPCNDDGERTLWSYARGLWVDTLGPSWKGVPVTPGEADRMDAENADLDARISAINVGLDADELKGCTPDEVSAALEHTVSIAKAEEAAEKAAEEAAPPEEVLARAIPRLLSKLKVSVVDPAWYDARLKSIASDASVVASLVEKGRIPATQKDVTRVISGDCLACAGRHRGHTCGKGKMGKLLAAGGVLPVKSPSSAGKGKAAVGSKAAAQAAAAGAAAAAQQVAMLQAQAGPIPPGVPQPPAVAAAMAAAHAAATAAAAAEAAVVPALDVVAVAQAEAIAAAAAPPMPTAVASAVGEAAGEAMAMEMAAAPVAVAEPVAVPEPMGSVCTGEEAAAAFAASQGVD